MATHTIRARVHDGRFEPLEKMTLPEGAEVTVTIEVPEERKARPRVVFGHGPLGAPVPLTREVIYDEAD